MRESKLCEMIEFVKQKANMVARGPRVAVWSPWGESVLYVCRAQGQPIRRSRCCHRRPTRLSTEGSRICRALQCRTHRRCIKATGAKLPIRGCLFVDIQSSNRVSIKSAVLAGRCI